MLPKNLVERTKMIQNPKGVKSEIDNKVEPKVDVNNNSVNNKREKTGDKQRKGSSSVINRARRK